MSAENVALVNQIQALLGEDDIVARLADPQASAELEAGLAELVEPDFETVLVGPEYTSGTISGRGVAGFRGAWLDWTETFESYRIEIREVIDAGDCVLSIVSQGGRTKTGGVELVNAAGGVWFIRDGKVRRAEFHLTEDSARRAAGLTDAD